MGWEGRKGGNGGAQHRPLEEEEKKKEKEEEVVIVVGRWGGRAPEIRLHSSLAGLLFRLLRLNKSDNNVKLPLPCVSYISTSDSAHGVY